MDRKASLSPRSPVQPLPRLELGVLDDLTDWNVGDDLMGKSRQENGVDPGSASDSNLNIFWRIHERDFPVLNTTFLLKEGNIGFPKVRRRQKGVVVQHFLCFSLCDPCVCK